MTFQSPCIDHDNCLLDIAKLRAACRDSQFDADVGAMRAKAEDLKEKALAYHKTGDLQAYQETTKLQLVALAAYNDALNYGSSSYKTLLYSIRAHHRGRLHCLRQRQPDGSVIDLTLENQEALIQGRAGQRVLKRFLKDGTAQSAA